MIPPHILVELEKYRVGEHPYPFGGFLTAVLANDLVGAFAGADEENRQIMFEYASYLYNELPSRTGDVTVDYWGSYEAVANRIAEQVLARNGQPREASA